jgi:hypothetical protein
MLREHSTLKYKWRHRWWVKIVSDFHSLNENKEAQKEGFEIVDFGPPKNAPVDLLITGLIILRRKQGKYSWRHLI